MTQKERLVALIKEAQIECDDNYGMTHPGQMADFLLDNGVILPPVKVGDKVFMTTRKDILEMAITQIKVTANELIFDCADIVFDYEDFFFVGEIGKTVFLTREEAEATLEKPRAEGKQ